MDKQEVFVNVILPLPLPNFYTYKVPKLMESEIAIGKRVLVPFGKHKFYSAIIYLIHTNNPQNYQAKNILNILDTEPLINKKQLSLWVWMSEYYMCTHGEIMAAALPSAFKLASETKISIHPDFHGDISQLSEKELLIVNTLPHKVSLTVKQIEKITNFPFAFSLIKTLIDKEIIFVCEEVELKYKDKTEPYLKLSEPYQSDKNALNLLFQELEKSKRTQKQSDALLFFISLQQQLQSPLIPKNKLLVSDKFGESQLQSLIKKDILEVHQLTISRLPDFKEESNPSEIILSLAQEEALKEIEETFKEKETILFHGVTGSGKTEIYIKLIQEEINKGKQVLYLLPEIALTTQIINRLRKYFGDKVGVYHSHFNDSERAEIWNHVAEKNNPRYQIILGARSALFLPFYNLGLVIIDEEHDTSYKQFEPSPYYQARDTALVLAQLHQAKTLLGSATPSIESYFNTVKNKFGLVTLLQRYGGIDLPEIHIVDLKKEGYNAQGFSPYTKTLLKHIDIALSKKEQVILFQNRRGFSVHLECNLCNHIPTCKYCDVTLTYHKFNNQLRCHYCGYFEKVPAICPSCSKPHLEMRGFGTEKIEEDLQIIYPSATIARLDYDSTRSKNAYQKIIHNFEKQKINILVGTQMITKGLDFDNVSTVGILNADNMLFFPDFRSYERAFQMLSQVSGRAGRKNKQGKVFIQTFNPQHPIFQNVIYNDYQSFFNKNLLERQQFHYPPFYRFIKITLKHKKVETLNPLADKFAHILKAKFPSRVLGPEFPFVSKVRNYYQKDIIVKLLPNNSIKQYKNWIKQIIENPEFKNILFRIDVDPY